MGGQPIALKLGSGKRLYMTMVDTSLNFKSRGLHIVHLNVRSILAEKRREQLVLSMPIHGPDVFTISESWLNPSTPDNWAQIEGYNMIRLDREVINPITNELKKGGGLMTYVRDSFTLDGTTLQIAIAILNQVQGL